MYKKYIAVLLIGNFILLAAWGVLTGLRINYIVAEPAFYMELKKAYAPEITVSVKKQSKAVSSSQRILAFEVTTKENIVKLSEEDYEVLLRIVEAEAGGEDTEGKMLVAGVVLNRVASPDFPNTVKEVVFQRTKKTVQFSPVYSGRYDKVKISEGTIDAVDRVLGGEDISEGALFFAARRYADPGKMRWFDEKLDYLFTHGGHEFFK